MTPRILHVCQPTDGGAAVIAAKLVAAGVGQGFDVTVASPEGGYLRGWVETAGASWVELPMGRAPSLTDLAMVSRARRLMRNADVVHLHSSKAGAIGRIAGVTLGRSRPAVMFTPHGWSWFVGGRMEAAYRRFERWAGAHVDIVTVVSEEELSAGRTVLGAGPRIELVSNGVDLADFAPNRDGDGPASGRLLVQVGRLSEQKGQDRSLRVLAQLDDDTVRLRFVGSGPDETALRQQASELRVDNRVEFVGSVDPRPHFNAADVVLLPSRWEGMSLVLLEAMASGCAIVASDCGGVEALVGCGLIVPHKVDAVAEQALANSIQRLLADNALRNSFKLLARQRAEEKYNFADRVAAYTILWQELASLDDPTGRRK